ncbi:MAG: hypothetical protein JXR76_21115 [Deltaproteobacteria bacterium]|nr:hypothetical protein [Deltaproteobacteria bacterium]
MSKLNLSRTLVVFMSIAALLLIVNNAAAKGTKNAKKSAVVEVEGTLSVTTNEKKKVEAIEITDESGETVHIVVNAQSKKKAKKFDGKQVTVSGKMNAKLSKKHGEKWMVLKKIKAAPTAAEE